MMSDQELMAARADPNWKRLHRVGGISAIAFGEIHRFVNDLVRAAGTSMVHLCYRGKP